MSFKVLCDVHIAFKVVKFFEKQGYEAIHINNILDSYYTKDNDISSYANQYGFTVLIKDIDFKNSHFIRQTPRRLLHITLGNIPTNRLIKILESNLEMIVQSFESEDCLLELGEGYMKIN